jgi:hypothetical protein
MAWLIWFKVIYVLYFRWLGNKDGSEIRKDSSLACDNKSRSQIPFKASCLGRERKSFSEAGEKIAFSDFVRELITRNCMGGPYKFSSE